MERTKVLLWYLKRPFYYPELARQFLMSLKLIFNHKKNKKQKLAAQKWCEENQITSDAALRILFSHKKFENFDEKFKEQLLISRDLEKNCPVKMGGPGALDLIYNISEQLKATQVIETGVAYGWSSLALLLSLNNRKNSLLISTDKPYPGLKNEQYVGCVVPSRLKNVWEIIRLPDRQALPQALRIVNSIDLCHYDSDKSYEGRSWAYPLLWNSLRPGGIFISDDISDNLAFLNFCQKIKRKPLIVKYGSKYIGIIKK